MKITQAAMNCGLRRKSEIIRAPLISSIALREATFVNYEDSQVKARVCSQEVEYSFLEDEPRETDHR